MKNRFASDRTGSMKGAGLADIAGSIREMGWLDLPPILWRRRVFIVLTVSLVVVATAGITLLLPNMYRSSASILPSGDVDQLSDFKSLVGLGSPSPKAQNSSMLFPVILESKTIRDAVASRTYSYLEEGRTKSVKLENYFGVTNPDRLRAKLAQITLVSQDKKNGVISVEAETKSPGLSRAILQGYLDELESFNMHKRRSQAHENAAYLERQLAEKESAMHAAEDSLEQYQKVNRGWSSTSDPELSKIMARMQRNVDILSQAYLYLRQQYEIALFEAQKDVPIVRILDSPSQPTLKSGPRRLMVVFTSSVAAFFGAIFWILVADVRGRRRLGASSSRGVSVATPSPRSVRLRRSREVRSLTDISA